MRTGTGEEAWRSEEGEDREPRESAEGDAPPPGSQQGTGTSSCCRFAALVDAVAEASASDMAVSSMTLDEFISMLEGVPGELTFLSTAQDPPAVYCGVGDSDSDDAEAPTAQARANVEIARSLST